VEALIPNPLSLCGGRGGFVATRLGRVRGEKGIGGEGKEANLRIRRTLLNFLVQGQRLDRSLVSFDSTLIPSQEITEQTG
jgi:hypothetical protein